MKILKVIHGYPMRYNAGSEVYSQTLCHGLAERGHSVNVFTREEDSFTPDFNMRIEHDSDDKRVTVHLVNNPRMKDRYRVEEIDNRFAEALEKVIPDVVHIGHLNHLSTGIVEAAKSKGIPIVFTLHDYWLMCPRGQFMQFFPEDKFDIWACCGGQDNEKCAKLCYARYFSGEKECLKRDLEYWGDWVKHRMEHTKKLAATVDVFITPAKYLRNRFHKYFEIPENKLIYLDYGFDLSRFGKRDRKDENSFVFGYIGTHIPAKGIHVLIEAFGKLSGNAILRIWGRPSGQDTESLKRMSMVYGDKIEWRTEYKNQNIVEDVFNHCDAIVVPSIWVENSPLVIHEAQQARVPVITANIGGMAEYVHHEVNGLLFEHRLADSLAERMQRFVNDPELAKKLGDRGYLFSNNGDIPSIEKHVCDIEKIYNQLARNKK